MHLCRAESPSSRGTLMKDALTPPHPSPDDNGHPFAKARRHFCRGPREARRSLSPPQGYPHPPSALRRTKSALGSLVFLPVYPSSSTVPPPSHSLVQCIPLCSNYEKECSFGTRRGTHNGQQPLETIIDPRYAPLKRGRRRPSYPTPPNF